MAQRSVAVAGGTRRVLLKQSVAERILTLVREQYEINQKLPSESQLMTMTGSGRSSVREALHGLAVLGIVEIRQGKGTYVRSLIPRTLGGGSDGIADALTMGITEDLLEARMIVEVRMASLAAHRSTAEDLERMRVLLETTRADLARKLPVFQLGAEFHMEVSRAAHNAVLEGFVTSYLAMLTERGTTLGLLPGYNEWELSEHSGIFEAIQSRNARLAAQRMRTHLEGMTIHYEHLSAYRPLAHVGPRHRRKAPQESV